MSVSKWAYNAKICDGDYCLGDCDLCYKTEDALAQNEEDDEEELRAIQDARKGEE